MLKETSDSVGEGVLFFQLFLDFWAQALWTNYFSGRNYLKINISHIFESKSYQINSIKSCSSSKIFPTTPKAHSNSSEIFSYNFI
jgi:hypothetical protein